MTLSSVTAPVQRIFMYLYIYINIVPLRPQKKITGLLWGVKLQDIQIMLAVNGKKKIIGEFVWRALSY